jgi:uncharacterized protein
MKFEILGWNQSTNEERVFYYDNDDNVLSDATGHVYEYSENHPARNQPKGEVTIPFDKNTPLRKDKLVTFLRIQLGLSCNYSCDYCSQRFIERPKETSKKDIEDFMAKLEVLEFDEAKGLKIEFWGGEPLVYWKTLKPLAEALVEKFAHWKRKPVLGIITNGSLLNKEICSWLYFMGFGVAISHDGPGQHVRGPDPFEDPKKKKDILDFYKVMHPKGRISFNSVLCKQNQSRKEIYEWFVKLTGDPTVKIGEGVIVDVYNDATNENVLVTKQEHFEYRRQAFNDIHESGEGLNFIGIYQRIDGFINAVLTHSESKYLDQKCGMDSPNTMALDLRGDVITCQNTSAVEIGPNGESHLGGNLSDFDNIALTTSTHWKNRPHCSTCPVLHICKGSCMFLDGEYWDTSCANAYSDYITMFALAMEKITGFIPAEIKGEGLPLHRQDIWGTRYKHEEVKRKVIPLKFVTEMKVIDDIEVYAKPKAE